MKQGNKILLVLSLIAIIAGMAIFFEASSWQKKCKVTEGIVTARDTRYYTVKFKSDDGIEHSYKGLQSKNKKYYIGDKFKVFYQADNPENARFHDGKKGGRTIIIVGILMLLLDIYLIKTNNSRKQVSDAYKANGRKVKAEITGVETDLTSTILDKHPFVIKCKWVDPMSGREYNHVIDQIWKDPSPYLAGRKTIDVYIDRDNPEKYFLDIEFLAEIKAY
jgi:hypothetical protein